MPEWLNKAIFYEIYPQTFYDSNDDGIGDIEGIIEKLDYIKELGCNAIWLNPCFDSPFKDAGYDVRDYKKVAPRYGSNEDLFRLFDEAHRKDMRVLLDLVPGHTSEEHFWFTESKKITPRDEFKNRYIWTDSWFFWGLEGLKYIAGEAERDGCYIINFFKCQPALNYGFLNHREKWQLPPDNPDCIATREALKDIMRFWLSGDAGRGCDGFRVDMADSLVKFDDDKKSATSAIWRNIREMLDSEFPEAAIISEWSNPVLSLKAGFHADFLLDHWKSGYRSLVRDYEDGGADNSYFKKDSSGDINRFLAQYLPWYEATKNDGLICMITGNHDTPRISHGLERRELALAFAVIFTMPGVPFLYYGDEIGMRYLHNLPTKEGGYTRTGSRTPMQWLSGSGMGFSAAPLEKFYLPTDPDPSAPNVAAEEKDLASLLNTVKSLLRLRREEEDLSAKPNLEIIYPTKKVCTIVGDSKTSDAKACDASNDRSFVYRRGALVMAVNPGASPVQPSVSFTGAPTALPIALYAIGDCCFENGSIKMGPQSFGVWKVK
jgi:maltose alpha-D-glucosyltransferase/alpha-amylase